MDQAPHPIWLGPLVVVAGIVSVLLRHRLQESGVSLARQLLGDRRAERYYARMPQNGWAGLSVLPGAVLIWLGLDLTVAAVSYH